MLNFNARETTHFKFWAKGISDALVTLLPETTTISQDEKRYQIVIGGSNNQMTWIWQQGPWTTENSPISNGVFLSTTEYRPFWLSWANNNITVGRGQQIGMDVLSIKDTSSYPIETNYLSVQSHGTKIVTFKYGYTTGNFLSFV